jgi:hypothetical protein
MDPLVRDAMPLLNTARVLAPLLSAIAAALENILLYMPCGGWSGGAATLACMCRAYGSDSNRHVSAGGLDGATAGGDDALHTPLSSSAPQPRSGSLDVAVLAISQPMCASTCVLAQPQPGKHTKVPQH